MMKMQLALDDVSFQEALDLLENVHSNIDIVEVGTPFIIRYGMEPVRTIRERYPELEILADTKIMDAGEYEAELAFRAGADYVTVLGVTDIRTIRGCLNTARKYGKSVMVDMICVDDLATRVAVLESAGVDYIGVHVGVDQQAAGITPLQQLAELKSCTHKSMISAAGGISIETIEAYKNLQPDVIIVGGAINHAEDPAEAARQLYKSIHM